MTECSSLYQYRYGICDTEQDVVLVTGPLYVVTINLNTSASWACPWARVQHCEGAPPLPSCPGALNEVAVVPTSFGRKVCVLAVGTLCFKPWPIWNEMRDKESTTKINHLFQTFFSQQKCILCPKVLQNGKIWNMDFTIIIKLHRNVSNAMKCWKMATFEA